jgi:hypothetical protein
MDAAIGRFYKLGITTDAAIDAYVNEKMSQDKIIKDLLKKLGVMRDVVTQFDRDLYTTWTDVWNFSLDIIDHVVTLGAGKASPMSYMNKVLASFHEKKVTSLEQAKATNFVPPGVNITRHSYSDEELRSLFANIEEVKF